MEPDPTSEKDFIGSIDKSVIGFGLAVLALIPTQILAIFRPDKLWPLIAADEPRGRSDFILSPGIFFLLSTAFHSLIVYRFIGDGSVLQMSRSVDNAVQGANLGQILLSLAPAFVVALIVALLVWGVTRLMLQGWTIRHSLKTALYAAAAIQWIIFPIELLASQLGPQGSLGFVLGLVILFAVFVCVWFCILFNQFTGHRHKEALAPALIIGCVWGTVMFLNYNGVNVLLASAQ